MRTDITVTLSPDEVEMIRILVRGEAFGETQLVDFATDVARSVLRKLAEAAVSTAQCTCLRGPPGSNEDCPVHWSANR